MTDTSRTRPTPSSTHARWQRSALGLLSALALAGPALWPATAQAAQATDSAAASAPPAQASTQVPGWYRQQIGSLQVTALYDGFIDLAPQLLKGMAPEEVQRLLARMFIANERGVQTAVNAYLVHTGSQLVLVDAGAASCFGPTLGQVGTAMAAAGVSPAQVDAVLLTHLHGDHACGLLDAQGRPVFPKATVWAARAEAGFWLDPATAAAAPEGFKPFFKLAQDSVAPYQKAGRFQLFDAGKTVLPGVQSVPSPGHTPGHGGFAFSGGARADQQLLVWGDLVHSHAVQFAHPEVAIEFDTAPAAAIASRKAQFEQSARSGTWVAGAHLPFPGLGHVRRDEQGYAWVPAEYGPLRKDR